MQMTGMNAENLECISDSEKLSLTISLRVLVASLTFKAKGVQGIERVILESSDGQTLPLTSYTEITRI